MSIVSEKQIKSADTIFAVATGAGKAAVSIIRISGPAANEILRKLCPGAILVERRATIVRIVDYEGDFIDNGMVLYFPSPRSFTGEDVIEFQVTGSRAILLALLRSLSRFQATRPAEAGEFTRRSFFNGKRDLAQVEGLSAIVEAETRAQLQHAQGAAFGLLSRECEAIRTSILNAMVMLEALLDFSDTEDGGNIQLSSVFAATEKLIARIRRLLQNSEGVESRRDGLTVVIAGAPNVGKSSLINCLAQRDVSIVSSSPGTTRDLIETYLDIGGFPVVLIDTAGIREPSDPIEAEGITRARKRRKTADLTLMLSSCLDTEEDAMDFGESEEIILVKTKRDLAPNLSFPDTQIAVSAWTGEGVDALISRISGFAQSHLGDAFNSLIVTQRQRAAILEAESALSQLLSDPRAPLEVLAENLRLAARSMGRVVGRIDVDELLGNIFSRLCIGK